MGVWLFPCRRSVCYVRTATGKGENRSLTICRCRSKREGGSSSQGLRAQIPLISQALSQEIPADPMGRIMIDGVVGSALLPLTNVCIQLAAERGTVNVCTP